MEKKLFRTLIKGNTLLGAKEYVRGKISGYQDIICDRDEERSFANIMAEKGVILTTKCTELQYDAFRQMVEKHYPGVCEFDYVIK